jgi:hypothetical protein
MGSLQYWEIWDKVIRPPSYINIFVGLCTWFRPRMVYANKNAMNIGDFCNKSNPGDELSQHPTG